MRAIVSEWPAARRVELERWLGTSSLYEEALRSEIARLECEAIGIQTSCGSDGIEMAPRAASKIKEARSLRTALDVLSRLKSGQLVPASVTIHTSDP